MNIRPLHDRIVVKRLEGSDSTLGGLFIPDSAKEKPQEGKVVAVSRGKRLEDGSLSPLEVALGDHIPTPNTPAARSSWPARNT